MIYYLSKIGNSEPRQVTTGIQLFGVILANNVQCFVYPPGLSALDFCKALVTCMKESARSVHALAAEVVGLLLRNIDLRHVVPMERRDR